MIEIPSPLKAEVKFSVGGEISGSDTSNAFFGDYKLGDKGFTTSNMGLSADGSAGMSKDQAFIVDAIDYVFIDSRNNKNATGTDVQAKFDGSLLVLEVGNYRTALRRA